MIKNTGDWKDHRDCRDKPILWRKPLGNFFRVMNGYSNKSMTSLPETRLRYLEENWAAFSFQLEPKLRAENTSLRYMKSYPFLPLPLGDSLPARASDSDEFLPLRPSSSLSMEPFEEAFDTGIALDSLGGLAGACKVMPPTSSDPDSTEWLPQDLQWRWMCYYIYSTVGSGWETCQSWLRHTLILINARSKATH